MSETTSIIKNLVEADVLDKYINSDQNKTNGKKILEESDITFLPSYKFLNGDIENSSHGRLAALCGRLLPEL